MTLPETAASRIPASFLPPPRKRDKAFDDVPIFDLGGVLAEGPGPSREQRLADLEAEARAENPNAGRDVPWKKAARKRR